MVIENILPFIKDNAIIFSFLGGFITGETVIMALAFFSATQGIPIWNVLIFSTLGMYLSDFIPFTFGRFKFLKNLFKGKMEQRAKKAEELLLKYTQNNLFLTLLYTKFIYGASIPALIYLGHKKTPYSKFILNNLLVEIIFVPIVFSIGWLSGKGFTTIKIIFKDIRIAVFLLIIFFIVFSIVRKWMNQELIKKEKQSI